MNYQALANELARDDYKALSDQEAADLLNAATIPVVRNVPTMEIATWAAENGVMAGLYMIDLSSDAPIALRSVVRTLLTVLERLDSWRILGDDGQPTAAAQAMMSALMQAGVMTEEQAAELTTMAITTVSRAQQLGIGEVLPGHIQMVREERV